MWQESTEERWVVFAMYEKDLMAVARAVGVWDPNEFYLYQLAKADLRYRQRRDYWAGGVMFSALFCVYLLLAFSIGGAA